jgi:hypothetical protein
VRLVASLVDTSVHGAPHESHLRVARDSCTRLAKAVSSSCGFIGSSQPDNFLTKTIPRVSTGMNLHVLAYNMKRAMQMLGIAPLMKAMRA